MKFRESKKTFKNTFDVKDLIFNCDKIRNKYKTLIQLFQSLRICVNSEFKNLQNLLNSIFDTVEVNGIVFLITFHSIEENIVKRFLKENVNSFFFHFVKINY